MFKTLLSATALSFAGAIDRSEAEANLTPREDASATDLDTPDEDAVSEVSPDELTIYLASNRDVTGVDLFFATRDHERPCGAPAPLPHRAMKGAARSSRWKDALR